MIIVCDSDVGMEEEEATRQTQDFDPVLGVGLLLSPSDQVDEAFTEQRYFGVNS